MDANLTAIGNSRGIRIPANIIQHYGLGDVVELVLQEDGILLKPKKPVSLQQIWAEQATAMQESGNGLIDTDLQDWADLGIDVGVE